MEGPLSLSRLSVRSAHFLNFILKQIETEVPIYPSGDALVHLTWTCGETINSPGPAAPQPLEQRGARGRYPTQAS